MWPGTGARHPRPARTLASDPATVLVALCVTEITSWGVLFYAFPVLAPAITASTGWSAPAIAVAFSAALVLAALVGVPVCRWLDRRGPHAVMTTGSVVATVAVVGIATAPTLAAVLAVVTIPLHALVLRRPWPHPSPSPAPSPPESGAALAAALGGYPAMFAALTAVAGVAALLAAGSAGPAVTECEPSRRPPA